MRRSYVLKAQMLALLLPTALLGGAFAFEYIGGLYPCEMCIWQRWPHGVAIVLAFAALFTQKRLRRWLIGLAFFAIAVSGAIGVFHAGVEQHWWQGLTRCATQDIGDGPLLEALWQQPLVRCDAIPWSLFGLSIAAYNGMISLLGAAIGAWWLKRG
jgi:disulfide bond formation protein DsbB